MTRRAKVESSAIIFNGGVLRFEVYLAIFEEISWRLIDVVSRDVRFCGGDPGLTHYGRFYY